MTTPPPPQGTNRAAYEKTANGRFYQPLSAMSREERRMVCAYLRLGRFDKAADECRVHRDTVSDTWHRWRGSFLGIVEIAEEPEDDDCGVLAGASEL